MIAHTLMILILKQLLFPLLALQMVLEILMLPLQVLLRIRVKGLFSNLWLKYIFFIICLFALWFNYTGSALETDTSNVLVRADNMECNVTSVSESTIMCTFTNPIAGSYNVSVYVKSIGKHYIVIISRNFGWGVLRWVGWTTYLVQIWGIYP